MHSGLDKEAARLEDHVVERMISIVEAEVDSLGWDVAPSLTALVDPLTLELLTLDKGENVDADTLVGATHLTSFQGPPHIFLMRNQAPDWALGLTLIVEAWSYPEHISADVQAVTLPWDHQDPGETRLCVTVLRDGRVFWLERSRGQEPTFRKRPDPRERMISALQRSLELPTPAPEVPVDVLAGRLWLQDAVTAAQEALAAGEALTWDGEALTNTSIHLELNPRDPRARGITLMGWEGLRLQAEGGGIDGLSPEDAQWLDEGAFSRLLLGSADSTSKLLELLSTLTDTQSAAQIRERLAEFGWLEETPGADFLRKA